MSANQAANPVLKARRIEIQEQPNPALRQLQVSEQLGLVEGQQGFQGLQLDDYRVAHHEIRAKSAVNLNALVRDGNSDLLGEGQSLHLKFPQEAWPVDALQQTGAALAVQFHPATDDLSPRP